MHLEIESTVIAAANPDGQVPLSPLSPLLSIMDHGSWIIIGGFQSPLPGIMGRS